MAPTPPGRASTGIPQLDLILRGGLPVDRVHLIHGCPGSGKTTLGMQFLIAGKALGEKGLFVALAQNADELRSVAEVHGMDFAGIEIFEAAGATEDDRPEREYTALHPAEVELGESFQQIVEAVERIRPKRVVIDSLTELRMLAHEPVRYRRQITSLKNFLMKRGCTACFIDAPADHGVDDAQVKTICHGVIRLEPMAPEYGRERRQLRVEKMRGVDFFGGFHDYAIQKGGLVVWPRLVAADHQRAYAPEQVGSGLPEIDRLLGGGPARGTTALIIGPAGVGKSSLCHQFCKGAAGRGEYFAWFSFDERLETVYRRAEGMGMELRGLNGAGGCGVEQVDPGSLSPGEFMQRVQHEVEVRGARMVVIDSLNGYLSAMPGERYLIIQMHELLTYLSRMGVLTVIVVAQHGLLSTQLVAPIDLSYLSDTILFLRYFEHAGDVRRALSVVKQRSAPHETTIREFLVTASGVGVGGPLQEFEGVLSGTPRYIGRDSVLLDKPRGGADAAAAD